MDVKFPDVHVQLTGRDGNAFVIIGAVDRALKRANHHEAAKAFVDAAIGQPSYDDLLLLAMTTVSVS